MNDFAFKYVFGADTKESNEALKGILEIYLNMKIKDLKIKNPEMTKNIEKMKSSRFDILVELDNHMQVDIEMQVVLNREELAPRLTYYLCNMFSRQNMQGKLYSDAKQAIVLIFIDGKFFKDPSFYQEVLLFSRKYELFCEYIKIVFIELPKLDETKSITEMNAQEKIAYYFLNCQDAQNNSKIKELIEQERVIQMVDKRVNQIEEDYWRKLDHDFAEFEENERQVLNKKWQEKYEKALEEKHQEGLDKGRQEGLDKGRKEGIEVGMIQTIRQLSKTLSVAQIALALEISEEKVMEYLEK